MNSKNTGINANKEGFSDESCGIRARAICRRNVALEAPLSALQNY